MNIKRLKNRVLRGLYNPTKKKLFDPDQIARTFNDMERALDRQSREFSGGYRKRDRDEDKEEK